MQTQTADAATFVSSAYHPFDWKHATTILTREFPDAYSEVLQALANFRLFQSDILAEGGAKSRISKSIETPLFYRGWKKQEFDLRLLVNNKQLFAQTRHVDHFKNRVALEIEWSNKLPFFDRDLDNFRLLYQLNLISVGIIITRYDDLDPLFKELRKTKGLKTTKYGPSTTHMSKVVQRIEAGSGAGCPILVFGISKDVYVVDGENKES